MIYRGLVTSLVVIEFGWQKHLTYWKPIRDNTLIRLRHQYSTFPNETPQISTLCRYVLWWEVADLVKSKPTGIPTECSCRTGMCWRQLCCGSSDRLPVASVWCAFCPDEVDMPGTPAARRHAGSRSSDRAGRKWRNWVIETLFFFRWRGYLKNSHTMFSICKLQMTWCQRNIFQHNKNYNRIRILQYLQYHGNGNCYSTEKSTYVLCPCCSTLDILDKMLNNLVHLVLQRGCW